MPSQFSTLDSAAIDLAKALLARPERPQQLWPVLGAAALLAASTLVFATAMVMAPPVTSEHPLLQRAAN